jgi:outer membrane protein OmpA-like peptidoglycan-associated protein
VYGTSVALASSGKGDESIGMRTKILTILALSAFIIFATSACATRKYARNRVNERITPLEQRTGELEETSRRNTQDIASLNAGVKDVSGRVDRAQAQADTALARANAANTRAGSVEQSMTDLRENLDKYSLQNTATVNFEINSADLSPESMTALDQLASQIKDRDNFILEIQGFADAKGSDTFNDQLTQKRAEVVRRYLADRHNISLYRMHVLGFGKVRPVADNTTKEGRAMNRRVEIHLLTRTVNGAASTT